ncbi:MULTISPECIES: hypothetical protein [unclassified Streptomyces]|uniref:hypothetical protein n=1 Tax=unclassified Streptomyces TaxID=2593676 RepID=UPI002E16452F|nr:MULTISPECIES: hypothetical protein [unclassified Streptomyces]WSR23733.1 hypothetical protein OG573_34790 [Streptomyces sp. NBC_01205]
MAADAVCTLTKAVLALDEQITNIDLKIAARFRTPPYRSDRQHARTEPVAGAEFIICTGGDTDAFGSAGPPEHTGHVCSGAAGLKQRRDRLHPDQLDTLAEHGIDWA